MIDARTDDEIDREWARARCPMHHRLGRLCLRCRGYAAEYRTLRAAGVRCSCRDAEADCCELHCSTLG